MKLYIEIVGPFKCEDGLTAMVELEGQTEHEKIVLKGGRFSGELELQPRRLYFVAEPVDAQNINHCNLSDIEIATDIVKVDLEVLFDPDFGCSIPVNGVLRLMPIDSKPCYRRPDQGKEGRLFAAEEHMASARYIGLAEVDKNAERISVNGGSAEFDHETPLHVGQSVLKFGEICCLAGDYYAFLRESDKEDNTLAQAWPELSGFAEWCAGDYLLPLAEDSKVNTANLLKAIITDTEELSDELPSKIQAAYESAEADKPWKRYATLASINYCHFSCMSTKYSGDDSQNDALQYYRANHRIALRKASMATSNRSFLDGALVREAFACHFLVDMFASGHMRVPRRFLGTNLSLPKAAWYSGKMHDEDNKLGLWVKRRDGSAVWKASGDGFLAEPENRLHLHEVQGAVRASVEEVFTAYKTRREHPDNYGMAEARIPVPLDPGNTPSIHDKQPDGYAVTNPSPNHFPLCSVNRDGILRIRTGKPTENEYRVWTRFWEGVEPAFGGV